MADKCRELLVSLPSGRRFLRAVFLLPGYESWKDVLMNTYSSLPLYQEPPPAWITGGGSGFVCRLLLKLFLKQYTKSSHGKHRAVHGNPVRNVLAQQIHPVHRLGEG